VPLAERNVTADTEADLARQFGAAGIVGPIDEPAWADALAALDADAELPPDLGAPVTRAELRRWRPPLSRRGLTVLFTGLSGSGKSTIAAGVMGRLAMMDRRASLLDGDRVRRLLSSGLGFSREERETNVRRIGWVAAEITKHGGVAICAPIAPYAATREWVRRQVAKHGDFLLVHVATPLPVCEARDRKGLYAAARAGRIPLFTGISDPYEEPTDADLTLDTTDRSIELCVDEVLERLIAGRLASRSSQRRRRRIPSRSACRLEDDADRDPSGRWLSWPHRSARRRCFRRRGRRSQPSRSVAATAGTQRRATHGDRPECLHAVVPDDRSAQYETTHEPPVATATVGVVWLPLPCPRQSSHKRVQRHARVIDHLQDRCPWRRWPSRSPSCPNRQPQRCAGRRSWSSARIPAGAICVQPISPLRLARRDHVGQR
jgi:adenylyl-sulfate kinase